MFFLALIRIPSTTRGLEYSIHVCQGSFAEGVKEKFNDLPIHGANVMNCVVWVERVEVGCGWG